MEAERAGRANAKRGRWRRPGVGARNAFLCGLLALAAACDTGPSRRPNLVLVTLDTTRADRMSLYGHTRPTTPEIERLAMDAVVYRNAYSVSNWTLPSHASLFTGTHMRTHGARYDRRGDVALANAIDGPAHYAQYRAQRLGTHLETLAERLAAEGYETAGIVAGPWMKEVFGLGRGFSHYDDSGIDAMRGRRGASVSDAAIAWLEGREPGRPYFLFLNYYDPHGPYDDPAGYGREFGGGPAALERAAADPTNPDARRRALAVVQADYDGEIRYADAELGRVFEALGARGDTDRSWIVVTADHGELLGEHERIGHGHTLFEPELRIPLVVRPPGGICRGAQTCATEWIDPPIQLSAIAPLLLESLGIEPPESMQRPARGRANGTAFAEFALPTGRPRDRQKAWIEAEEKLVWRATGSPSLFDLATDPHEESDLASERPDDIRRLTEAMERFEAGLPRAPESEAGAAVELDADTRRALRELGYLGDDAPAAGDDR